MSRAGSIKRGRRIPSDVTHPLQDLVDCVLFALDSCFTELLGVQTFGGKLKLQLTIFSVKVKDPVA